MTNHLNDRDTQKSHTEARLMELLYFRETSQSCLHVSSTGVLPHHKTSLPVLNWIRSLTNTIIISLWLRTYIVLSDGNIPWKLLCWGQSPTRSGYFVFPRNYQWKFPQFPRKRIGSRLVDSTSDRLQSKDELSFKDSYSSYRKKTATSYKWYNGRSKPMHACT